MYVKILTCVFNKYTREIAGKMIFINWPQDLIDKYSEWRIDFIYEK